MDVLAKFLRNGAIRFHLDKAFPDEFIQQQYVSLPIVRNVKKC